ncbi:hypothetical protein Tco_1500224 [Tanacetum coccineum]
MDDDTHYRQVDITQIHHQSPTAWYRTPSLRIHHALRDRGIDARVVIEAVDRDETETGVRGPVEVRVKMVTHLVMPEDIPEPAQEGAVEAHSRDTDYWVSVSIIAIDLEEMLHERELTMRLIDTGSVKRRYTMKAHGLVPFIEIESFRKMPNTRSGASMTHEDVEELVNDRVAEEIEAREAARTLEPLNENGDELEGENGGNGKWRNLARKCTFFGLLKLQAHIISQELEGVVGLTRWFEKMETVFNISNCPPKYQVKYATCNYQDMQFDLWKSHKRTTWCCGVYAMNKVEADEI